MRIVIDTNVLVSALLSPDGTPARILDLVFAGHVVPVFDDRILAENRAVLARPRLGIDPTLAELILDFLFAAGVLVTVPPLALDLPDEDDAPFVETAAGAHSDALVTGNLKHFSGLPVDFPVPVLSPAQFLLRYHESTA